MGWWTVKRGEEELLQGDAPYDILASALDDIAREYEGDHGRRPTLRELLLTIEMALAGGCERYICGGDLLQVVSVTAKTRKRPKAQQFEVGDFFAIALPGGLQAFGRILSDARNDMGLGVLAGVYEVVSRHTPALQELQGGRFMFEPLYCNPAAWRTWRWRVIGNLPLREGEFRFPRDKVFSPSRGWLIREGAREQPATEDEVRALGFAQLWPDTAVENKIVEWLRDRGVLAAE